VSAGSQRRRLSPDERRRQFLGIGLRAFVARPLSEVSLEDVAREAGVSSGLLFHYFPTKTDFHRAVVEAAGRRVLRNLTPDDGVAGTAAVTQVVRRFLDQVDRRRESYVALVFGQGPVAAGSGETAETLRGSIADLVIATGHIPLSDRDVVHAWVAYVEDRALTWSAAEHRADPDQLAAHCVRALGALIVAA